MSDASELIVSAEAVDRSIAKIRGTIARYRKLPVPLPGDSRDLGGYLEDSLQLLLSAEGRDLELSELALSDDRTAVVELTGRLAVLFEGLEPISTAAGSLDRVLDNCWN